MNKNINNIIKSHWLLIIICLFLHIAAVCTTLFESISIKKIFDFLSQSEINSMLKTGVTLFICVGIGMIFNYCINYTNAKLAGIITFDLRLYIINKVNNCKIIELSNSNSGTVASIINNCIGQIGDFYAYKFPTIIASVFQIIILSSYLIYIDYKLYIISIVIIPLFFSFNKFINKGISENSKKEQIYNSDSNTILIDTIHGRDIIKAYNLTTYLHTKYMDAVNKVLEYKIKIEKKRSVIGGLTYFLDFIPVVLCVCYGGYLVSVNNMNIGSLIIYIQLFRKVLGCFKSIPDINTSYHTVIGVVKHLNETVLDLESEKIESNCYKELPHLFDIEIMNVSYSYNTKKNAVKNITLNVKKGEKIAIVGYSGCGKSTIAKLLCGFYDDFSGNISILGNDIKLVNLYEIRKYISYVSQDIYIYAGTILDNLKLANSDASYDEIIYASKIANLHEFVMLLPDQYNTNIYELGDRLSRGQKQRLSIARAVLKDSPIIILDEATSALDAETEMKFYKAFNQSCKEKTIISISHRLSTIKESDMIYLMEAGQIIAKGKHEELIQESHIYSDLFSKQFYNDEME